MDSPASLYCNIVQIYRVPVSTFWPRLKWLQRLFRQAVLVLRNQFTGHRGCSNLLQELLPEGLTRIAMFSRVSRAFSAALLYPSTITIGWTPLLSILQPFQEFAGQNDWRGGSIPNFRVLGLSYLNHHLSSGWSISILSRIVLPSLVIVTSPELSTNILSMLWT